MISTGFAYGERSKIADAYANMYAPKSIMNESCECGKRGCPECGAKDGVEKKTKTLGKLPVKHKVPAKTGSKLGVRKVIPFEKRDVKSSAKKITPKMKKVSESTRYFCIADGDRVLCTNDIGESYFNKGGTCGDMRIYESKISALKDISKVKARRNPKSKYKVRACECIGESVQFVDSASGHQVNEGWFDAVGNALGGVVDAGKGLVNTATGLVDNTVGQIPVVGDVTSAVTGGVNNIVGGVADAGKGVIHNVIGGGQQSPQTQSQQTQVRQSQSPQTQAQSQSPQTQSQQTQARQSQSPQTQAQSQSPQTQSQPQQAQPQQAQQNVQNTAVKQPEGQQAVGGTSPSTSMENVAKSAGYQNAEEMVNDTDETNNLGKLTQNATRKQIAAEKGQSMSDFYKQQQANKNVMSQATPSQRGEISKMLRMRNNPNNKNAPTMNDIQNKINGFAQQQQGVTAGFAPEVNNASSNPNTPQGGQQGNNASRKAEYDQKRAALDKEYADVVGK